MIGEIDHIEIEASDAAETVAFLKKLGYEEHRQTEHHGESYELVPGGDRAGPLFEIHEVEDEEVPGINHIAWSVDDIDAFTDHIEDQGVNHIVGPYDVEATGRRITNFRDPDGHRFQVVKDE